MTGNNTADEKVIGSPDAGADVTVLPLLSVIIVNYNVRYFLEQALLAVRKAAAHLPVEIFVVDNHSVDDSVQMVREKFPEVRLIENRRNTGFAVANNQAIQLSRGRHILLLNPDTVVEEDTFLRCLDFMEAHPDAGALGVTMIDGSGKYLPESKRGFPTPFVAFCKTFGLYRLFPRSAFFNGYYLGHLDPRQSHPVDVLAGAFMWIRRESLEQAGLLDEAFFMYGEDIDLSYRITKAGWKNYYFAGTRILHYKGESTKRGSLNYVRTFYQAMIIFAKKHFTGPQARWYVGLLQLAIYYRAAMTLMVHAAQRLAQPLLDMLVIGAGLWWIKGAWAVYYFRDPDYYDDTFLYFNLPLYTGVWVLSIFFSGGYDPPYAMRRLIRGLLAGTVLITAVYGMLPLPFRTSPAPVLLGAVWAMVGTASWRWLQQLLRTGSLRLEATDVPNVAIVGTQAESTRVEGLLHKAQVRKNLIGTIAPAAGQDRHQYLGSLSDLDELVRIYKVNEIIFCSRDVPTEATLSWMTRLGPGLDYRILPEDSWSIIGSSSRHANGELYTVDIHFNIALPYQRRNKRLLDVGIALALIPVYPLIAGWLHQPFGLLRNCLQVLLGKKTWVGYAPTHTGAAPLPGIRSGVLTPAAGLKLRHPDEETLYRLNFFYGKDYDPLTDLEIIRRGWRELGGG